MNLIEKNPSGQDKITWQRLRRAGRAACIRKNLLSILLLCGAILLTFSQARAEGGPVDQKATAKDSLSTSQSTVGVQGNRSISQSEADLVAKKKALNDPRFTAMSIVNLANDYVSLAVEEDGRFTLGTTGGNPDLATDDNKKMLYGHPNPSTSFTTIRVDGADNYYGDGTVVQAVSNQSTTTNVSEFGFGNVRVRQTLSIIKGISSNREDTLEIRYRISNQDTVAHTVGLRIMLDTMLGDNDAAPFKIPGLGDVTTETDFLGNAISEYWQAVDNLLQPGVIGQGTNATWQANRPDRFVIASWPKISDTMWEYSPNTGSQTGDSAVAVYWNPLSLSPGEIKEFVTYYGLSEFSTELGQGLAVNLTGPSSLDWQSDRYVPNPFTVTAYITNNTGQITNNVQAKLTLPEGLALYTGYQDQVDLGSLAVGETKQATWKVYAGDQSQDVAFNYTLTATSGKTEPTEVQRTVLIPESPLYQEPEQPVDPAFIVHRQLGDNYEQETSPRPHRAPEISGVTVTPRPDPGVYELYISDYFVDTSKGGQAAFFWSTQDGYFEDQELENYRRVIFHANPGTAGQELMAEVQVGDGLGDVAYDQATMEGAGEPSAGTGDNMLAAKLTTEPGLLNAWDTYPIVYEAALKDGSGNIIPGTRVSIYYSVAASGSWLPIATDLVDRTRYSWIVPDLNSQSVRLKLVATNGSLTTETLSNAFPVTPDIHIEGQVLDANGLGIVGARVTVGANEVYTDAAGTYIVNRLAAGNYSVAVSKDEVIFVRTLRDVQLSAANPSMVVNFHAR